MKFNNPVKKEVIVRYSPCGFSRKKKPISTIKALEVNDRILKRERKINLSIDKFYEPKKWEYHRAKVIDEDSGLVALVRH